MSGTRGGLIERIGADNDSGWKRRQMSQIIRVNYTYNLTRVGIVQRTNLRSILDNLDDRFQDNSGLNQRPFVNSAARVTPQPNLGRTEHPLPITVLRPSTIIFVK